MPYIPINGEAGTVTFYLVKRSTNVVAQSVVLNVFDFSEAMEDTEFTQYFTNIENKLIKDYPASGGQRKKIDFSVINAGSLGSANFAGIINLGWFIFAINSHPDTWKLRIVYRAGTGGLATKIDDAIQVGSLGLQELSASSNTGQSIKLTFQSKNPGHFSLWGLNYGYLQEDDDETILVTEDGLYNIIPENN